MNTNYPNNLRYCQKKQLTQSFIQLDMFQKKIRKRINPSQQQIDADMKMREINAFWKQNWKYQHFHPYILNPVTVNLNILTNNINYDFGTTNYYDNMIHKFVNRYKVQIQDQSTFKVQEIQYQRSIDYQDYKFSKNIVNKLLNAISYLSQLMLNNLENSDNQINGIEQSFNIDEQYYRAVYQTIRFTRLISNIRQQQQFPNQQIIHNKQQLIHFVRNIIPLIQKFIKYGSGSGLIAIQPQIDYLTYLIHPLLTAIIGYFYKRYNYFYGDTQNIQVKQDKPLPLFNLTKDHQQQQIEKIVFLNLDGFQSQFNLQFCRNYNTNLMYISFPKDSELRINYSKRLYKKIMFEYIKSKNVQQQTQNDLIETLTLDPQHYYESISNIYAEDLSLQEAEINKNIYILPIKLDILKYFHKDSVQIENIQTYQSYFIRFMIKNFIATKIQQFHPSLIIISYSGRLHIVDDHFVEIMQQCTKLSNHKVMLFPNLTTTFCTTNMPQFQNEDPIDYQNLIDDSRITYLSHQRRDQMSDNVSIASRQFLGKIVRFFKISSGTYNLMENIQQQPLISKYKNSKVFLYSYQLINILSKYYPGIRSILTQEHTLTSLNYLYQQNLKSSSMTIEKCVPYYHKNLYQILQAIIFNNPKQLSQFQKKYLINPNKYGDLIEELKTRIVHIRNYQDNGQKQLKEYFEQQKFIQFLQISDQKYQENTQIYIRHQSEKQYYQKQQIDILKTSSLSGIYFLVFYDQNRENIPITKHTKLIYNVNQQKSTSFPLLIINCLSQDQSRYKNYLSIVKKNNKSQRCSVKQIQFFGKAKNNQNIYQTLSRWSYTQTSLYMILFWPSVFDFVQYSLSKMVEKNYQPRLIFELYAAPKVVKLDNSIAFTRIQIQMAGQYLPRIQSNCYCMDNKIFIFGGFYSSQHNYLDLQHDILTFDFENYQYQDQTSIVTVQNLKDYLYSQNINFNKQRPNSLIRTKVQFQFFEQQQIKSVDDISINPNQKKVIMFGGYGQNFLRPYSLLTNYYYELTFNTLTKRLLEIHKKLIYDKSVPINVKEMIKNKNSWHQMNIFDQNIQYFKKGNLHQNHYLFHRAAYKIQKDNFNFQIKSFYATQQFTMRKANFQELAKKLGQIKVLAQNQLVKVASLNNINHYLVLIKGQNHYIVGIYYEFIDNQQINEVQLTNNNILSIDIKNNKILALIKHSSYTKDQCVLCISHLINFPNNQSDSKISILLKPIYSFKENLSMHSLIACNQHRVLLLHGLLVNKDYNVCQYDVRIRSIPQKNKYQFKKIQMIMSQISQKLLQCESFFIKKDLKIQCFNFYQINSKKYYILSLAIQTINLCELSFKWSENIIYQKYAFYNISQNNQVCYHTNPRIIQFKKTLNDTLICILQTGNQKYKCKLEGQQAILENQKVIKVFLLNPPNDRQWNDCYSAKKLWKNQQKYIDCYQI